jgi:hypothetical protein
MERSKFRVHGSQLKEAPSDSLQLIAREDPERIVKKQKKLMAHGSQQEKRQSMAKRRKSS